MASRNDVVKQARSWVGLKESNGSHKKIIDIYNKHTPRARNYKVKYSDAWCATFVSAVAIKCGATDIIPTECGCGQMIALFKKLGEWQENDAYKPEPGDVIFYDWSDSGKGDNAEWPDHVGIVEKVSGNVITVIEGNKSDAVGRRTINVNGKFIRGYGVPKYDGSSGLSSSSGSGTYYPAFDSGSIVDGLAGIGEDSSKEMRAVIAAANGIANYSGTYDQNVKLCDLARQGKLKRPDASSGSTPAASGGSTGYQVGEVYTLQSNMKVRTGPGTGYRMKSHSELTADGRKHDKDRNGCLDAGTKVTCKAVETSGDQTWIKCPSGWICARDGRSVFIK